MSPLRKKGETFLLSLGKAEEHVDALMSPLDGGESEGDFYTPLFATIEEVMEAEKEGWVRILS